MKYLDDDIKLFGRVVSSAQDGVIASAEQVKDYTWDDNKGEFQNKINELLISEIDKFKNNASLSEEDKAFIQYLMTITDSHSIIVSQNVVGSVTTTPDDVVIGECIRGKSGDFEYDDITIPSATKEHSGVMSADDKIKLDSLTDNFQFLSIEDSVINEAFSKN